MTDSIIYKLAERCTVLNGKGSGTVTVIAYEIEFKLDIYTTPKVDSTAFMVAKVHNYIKYSFFKCNANVFLNNRFIGTTLINPVSDDGTMIVSLGPDNKIQVRRVPEKQLSSKSFIGGTNTKEELYAIKIINGKPVPAHIIVVDQLPVSTHAKVMVERTTLSGGVVEDATGKVTWEIDINPNEETCCLLVREQIKDDDLISIKVDLEGISLEQGKYVPEEKPTYGNVKKWINEKYGFNVTNLYIGQVKSKLGLEKRLNYNVGSGEGRVPNCPQEKEEAIIEAFKHFGLI